MSLQKKALVLSVCAAALALGGCGGGGSSGGDRPSTTPAPPPATPAPPPPPPPPPAATPAPPPATPAPPPPPPPTSGSATEEYNRSNGASVSGAIAAYDAGASGKGVKIAVIDSGINPNLAEFAGRIDSASADVAANRGIVDTEGHGTAVAATAAAARNNSGMMGVAYEATIMSFNSSSPGTCDAEDGCSHYDTDIAQGVNLARLNGAKVINISLGGGAPGSSLLSAIGAAAQAGIVVVISAGNDGEANPDTFATSLAQRGNGTVIIAGAMTGSGSMASFSNKAGTGAQYFLTALGASVRTINQHGTATLYSGTSFSAPVISGAAALLASAFPNLTGAQIVDILLKSADDAGTTGQDAIFGNGILNIRRAFQPMGQTAMAGSGAPVSLNDNGQASGAMGDGGANTGQMAGAIILDGYSRAFAMNLASTLSTARPDEPLAQSLHGSVRSGVAGNGTTAVTLTVNRRFNTQPQVGFAQMGLTYEDSRQAKAVAGAALSRLSRKTAVAFGLSESGRVLQQRLTGHAQNAFLVARDPASRSGFQADTGTSFGIRHQVGRFGLTATSESGKVWNPSRDFRQSVRDPGYSINALTVDRKVGRATLSLGGSRMTEESTVLGGRFSSAFGKAGATSYFVDGTASFDLGRGWGAFASYRRGWTSLPGTGALVENGQLSTDGFAFDVSKRSAFARGDKLAFRVMQPLRVRSGGLALNMPVSYDYATGTVGYADRFFNLAPNGREIDFEAAYGTSMFGGDLSLNAFLRKEPGHIEAMSDDMGGAVRFSFDF